ncbi:MAG: 2-amino-4-hydroxy-6-hydroxymethyldihydropteridine diphosphokinase [Phycisphaerae bacterium]|nr:2-amino-4-hydroxy-6-hydroxymethyldihydropteridine diphosphokinase [Phycisphaerae bacterium]
METITAYIGLGANVGETADTLRRALEMLSTRDGIQVWRISQFIKTQPVGGPEDQPPYLNAAAEIHTTLSPEELLAVLHEVESALGRDRSRELRWGPRTCDLDILLYGPEIIDQTNLTIPHPRMHERRFVLEPLAQIAPNAKHPTREKTITELLSELR